VLAGEFAEVKVRKNPVRKLGVLTVRVTVDGDRGALAAPAAQQQGSARHVIS